ncbi:Lrp/AsnC family transcriptional regulator [Pedobacter metabolipauper]|uniref:DNA-binding Lrp family transcriptional regulator n=1 Tax=Pedobacter metabolipauper TaxID=425513 RepID=A0A4R6SUX3_9SPHI|nr:Lrp/AsnC family transcriptional regulator [Pedobacter metabolipauper]TDQ07547.1 DNA-binding Lrp family transcriptional regulator [Pedobacter metabolipauper]
MFNIPGLDSIDLQILQILQENANVPAKQIAKLLHRSLSVIYDRIRILKKKGIIHSGIILLNHEKIPGILIVHTLISFTERIEDSLVILKKMIYKHDEVMECYQVTGKFDFNIKTVTQNMASYHKLHMELSAIPFLGTIESYVVIAEHKNKTAIQLI